MGMVSESYQSQERTLRTSELLTNSGSKTGRDFVTAPETYKVQHGFRSGPLSETEMEYLYEFEKTHLSSGRTRAKVDALDRIQRATSTRPLARNGLFGVNPRDYSITERLVAPVSSTRRYKNSFLWEDNGFAQATSFYWEAPKMPSDGELEPLAAKQMRAYTPTRPDFDLARFVGELRDTPRLLGLLSGRGGASQYAGSAYVGYNFGVAPTVSDIKSAAEAVLKADELTRQFIKDSSEIVSRKATIELDSRHYTAEGSTHAGVQTSNLGGVVVKRDLGGSSSATGPRYRTNLTFKRNLRVFSLFEYFVGDPYGFTTRMDSYVGEAHKVLGSGFTLSTAYELTPWSWFGDWFYDIGGLLAYQQQVADFSLVQRRGGYVVEDVTQASVNFNDRYLTYESWWRGTGTTVLKRRVQKRRSGSPYSMAPTWPTSASQWAILGALGLAKAPGIPLK